MSRTTLSIPVDDETSTSVKMSAEQHGQSVSEYVRRRLVVNEPPIYRFAAGGISTPSILRDLRTRAGFGEDGGSTEADEAHERLRKFERWVGDNPLAFTTQTTSTASQVVPPGFQDTGAYGLGADTPLLNACEQRPISGSAAFSVPRASGDAVVPASRVEGVNPSGADPTYGTIAVTPVGLAGTIDITRELLDSASGGGDSIMMRLLAEDLGRRVEERIYTAFNDATTGAGGTITAGFVPSGAQARVSTTPATNLLFDLRKAVLEYSNVRRRKARSIVAGSAALTYLGGLLGAEANTGDDTALAKLFGARLNGAVTDWSTGSTDMRVAILGADDCFVFSSPVQRFEFSEVVGPALARVAVWQYVGIAVARPRGLSSIRFT